MHPPVVIGDAQHLGAGPYVEPMRKVLASWA